MSTVTKLKGGKLHFLKRRESEHTLSNGWKVTLRRLSGAKKAEIEAMAFEMVKTDDKKNTYEVKAKATALRDQSCTSYCEAFAEMIVRIEDGNEVMDGKGKPIFTPAEIGEFDEDVFKELRDIYDGAKDEGKA